MSGYRIRRASTEDLPGLGAFFRTAYGERTILQHEGFLLWFFRGATSTQNAGAVLNAFVALDEHGDIVAHYGFLPSLFSYGGQDYPLVWGVSAFTLPAHRQSGLGKSLVEAVQDAHDLFGVIGFSEQTARFYDKAGFNVFGLQRFTRHVMVLDERFREIADWEGIRRTHMADALRPVAPFGDAPCTVLQPREEWDDAVPTSMRAIFTRRRTSSWLAWRFDAASQLDYQIRTLACPQRGRGLIAYRSVPLTPTVHRIMKVVDLYGDEPAVDSLLDTVARAARSSEHLYLQFDSFGSLYATALRKRGFVALAGDDLSFFPSLHNPVGFRPNREYVGIFSKSNRKVVAHLDLDTVYLNQADSDRDRRASV